jgi:hypothetical protein
VIAFRFVFSRKIRGPATFDFCNNIGQQRSLGYSITWSASARSASAVDQYPVASPLKVAAPGKEYTAFADALSKFIENLWLTSSNPPVDWAKSRRNISDLMPGNHLLGKPDRAAVPERLHILRFRAFPPS